MLTLEKTALSQRDGPLSGVQMDSLLGETGHDSTLDDIFVSFISAASNSKTVKGFEIARWAEPLASGNPSLLVGAV